VRLLPAPPRPGAWREIGIDPAGELRVPPGTALDLGATGKGFAADLVAAELAQRFGCGIVVSLGGDVAVAGEPPVTEDGVGWPVDVGDEPSGRQTVLLDSGGLATSSTRRRVWRHGGLLVHHLLDPVTGMPVPMIWDEVSVRAATCLDANTATTACMVLGESAPIWLHRDRVPGRLVGRDGCLVLTAGWPPA
jgi:thiamine biosynthesis lipoprotein